MRRTSTTIPFTANVISLAQVRQSRQAAGDAEMCKIATIGMPQMQACKTGDIPEKTNGNSNESEARSRTGYSVTQKSAATTCMLLGKGEFQQLVEEKSVQRLRQIFKHEHSCHTAMLDRGRKGATVHPDLRAFKAFLRHMGQAPSKNHTIDRIETWDKEYSPGKIRWLTPEEQARNRSSSIELPYKGENLPLARVAEITGQKPDTMRARLRDQGWTKEEVVAGVRTGQALTTTGWPAGATVSKWDGPYKAWLTKVKYHPKATKAVFFCWISRNHLRANARALTAEYPEFYSSEVDPDNDTPLPPHIAKDQRCLMRITLLPMEAEAFSIVAADPGQIAMLRMLGKFYGGVFNQKTAHEYFYG